MQNIEGKSKKLISDQRKKFENKLDRDAVNAVVNKFEVTRLTIPNLT